VSRIDAVIVSHTHWDREWYRPFQEFRYRLVALIDQVLDILAAQPDFRHFTLDGQAILLEDYLALRPQREEELRQHVRAGRLLIGPWYVLPDEFLVGGESTVRNLMLGRKVCRRFGEWMAVGYVPDPFGHIGQLPQILALCGIDSAVFRRGLADEPAELWWEAPDGTRILAIYLRDGYDNAAHLPTDLPGFMNAIRRQVASLAPHCATSHILLMNGTDHMAPQPDLPARMRAANAQMDDIQLRHGTLPQFIMALKAESLMSDSQLSVVRGELRSPKRHPLLPGVLSTRMWIKQHNDACEIALTRYAEPLAALGHRFGGRDLRAELEQAWRNLIENHPHDSICGCSIDAVHAEMKTRFAGVAQLAEAIAMEGLETLARQITPPATIAAEPDSAPHATLRPGLRLNLIPARRVLAMTVFNPTRGPRTDLVTFDAPTLFPDQTYRLLDGSGQEVATTAADWRGRLLAEWDLDPTGLQRLLDQVATGRLLARVVYDAQAHLPHTPLRSEETGRADSGRLELALTETGDPDLTALGRFVAGLHAFMADGRIRRWTVHAWLAGQVRASFIARDLPGCGYRTYWLRRESALSPDRSFETAPIASTRVASTIENEFFRVTASPQDGTLTLVDKRTGVSFAGLNLFVDNGDRGDEYNHCAPAQDMVIDRPAAAPQLAVYDEGPVGWRLEVACSYRLPAGLAAGRERRSTRLVEVPLTSRVWLRPGVPRVDIETTVDNRVADHRLRVLFPTPFHTDQVLAEGQFDVVARSLDLPEDTAGWIEQPVPTIPQCGFSAVQAAEQGLMVANRGLPEVEVIRGASGVTIALTLLRCVGWLSRDDLACRSGLAGPGLPTPDAQCPGAHTFAYALIPFTGPLSAALHQAQAFRAPLRAVVNPAGHGSLPPSQSWIDLAPPELVLSALKPAEDGDGVIVRFWNTTDRPVTARLSTGFEVESAEQVNLLEDRWESVSVHLRRWIELPVRGKQIVSLRLR